VQKSLKTELRLKRYRVLKLHSPCLTLPRLCMPHRARRPRPPQALSFPGTRSNDSKRSSISTRIESTPIISLLANQASNWRFPLLGSFPCTPSSYPPLLIAPTGALRSPTPSRLCPFTLATAAPNNCPPELLRLRKELQQGA
jgi:hypothetical protein